MSEANQFVWPCDWRLSFHIFISIRVTKAGNPLIDKSGHELVYLQKAANDLFCFDIHVYNILKQPEYFVIRLSCHQSHEDTIEIEEQYSSSTYNMIRYDTIQYDTIWYNTIWYTTIQYDTIQYDTIHYDIVHYDIIQYDTV